MNFQRKSAPLSVFYLFLGAKTQKENLKKAWPELQAVIQAFRFPYAVPCTLIVGTRKNKWNNGHENNA